MPAVTKITRSILVNFSLKKAIFQKIIEGEVLLKIQATTLLQIFYELMVYSKVILKSTKGSDDTCQGDFQT